MKTIQEDVLLRNNTGNKSKQSLVDGFVVRTNEFQEIFNNLRNTSLLNHKQHYLIIGQRGAGKTSLMHRINYAIEDDKKLSGCIIPILFSEEQYNLSELVNLWESIGNYLEDQYSWSNISLPIENIISEGGEYEFKVYSFLCSKLKEANLSLVLFIENINIFLKKLDDNEKDRLKQVLVEDSAIRLISTSTSYNDGNIDFSGPWYNFLKLINLDGLDKAECEKLLLKIGEQYGQKEQIKHIIENYPGRIESLRRLTGGIPRTISYLFQIFLDNENGKAIKDLYILIDTLTLLYKSELDQLSTQQQKVIDIIAKKWDAIAVKDIAKATRLESKNISTILSALEKNQLIEKVQTDSKNHLYRIKERFMNIWYLMRFGRKHDKENVVWLVRFFDAWCEKKELNKLITAHINNLRGGSYDINAAIDMGNTFLSCVNVSDTLKRELLRITKSILPKKLLDSVKWSGRNEYSAISELITQKNFEQALIVLSDIDEHDIQYYTLASYLYLMVGDYKKSAEAAHEVLNLDETDANAALTLGVIYEDFIKDIDSAIIYYQKSLSQQPYHPYAASKLGDIAFFVQNDVDAAIKYHTMAIKKSFRPSLLSLGKIYLYEQKFDEARKFLLEAEKHNVKGVYVELGQLYANLDDPKNTTINFEKAVKNEEDQALLKFGMWHQYKRRPNYKKAQALYKEAIDSKDINAYGYLGQLYHHKFNDEDKAFEIYTEGMEHGDASCVHQLAHLYADRKEYEKSDALFLKANEMGEQVSILCLANDIYARGRKDKKKFALQILEENLDTITKEFDAEIFYAKILLWNNHVQKSVNVIKDMYEEIAEIKLEVEEFQDDIKADRLLSELFSYFLLLLAKKEYQTALDFFNNVTVDFKTILKPIYFVLMESLKNEFPLEYLKAGEEFKDTIKEIKLNINKIQKII